MVSGDESPALGDGPGAEKAHGSGGKSFPEEILCGYEKKYMDSIASGRKENKQPGHRYAKKDEKALLDRLEKYMHNHLLFLHDFSVPFDDNMSGRDLRKVKNRLFFSRCNTR